VLLIERPRGAVFDKSDW